MEGDRKPSRLLSFPKAARIRARREFLVLQRSGRRLPARHFLVVFDDRSGEGPQLGVTVTKKIGNAVTRNLLKRRLREIFRQIRHSLPSSARIVVVVREGAAKLGYQDTARELLPLFDRISERWAAAGDLSRPAAGGQEA